MLLHFLSFFAPCAAAQSTDGAVWYNGVWDALDNETEKLLEEIGVTSGGENGFLSLAPGRVAASLFSLFGTSFRELLGRFFTVIAVLLCVALFTSLAGEGKTAEAAANVGNLAAAFVIIAVNAELFADCRASIELTKDLMLSLIPVFTGIVAFSGQPGLAASFQTVVFAFAETVSVAFCNILPAAAAAGTSLGAASAVAPFAKFNGICKVISKLVNTAAAFVSGIFVAVLSVRGVIAGAADTVTIKGLRFLIGSSVPLVGSAIGDALNSVAAGLGLIKNSVLVLGAAAVALINLPSLLKLAAWSFLSYFISLFAEMLSQPRIAGLLASMKSVVSVLAAVTCFNSFVYIISCAILITVKGGGG